MSKASLAKAPAPRNNGDKTAKPMPPVEHQFKPGNPGRPKGARNKLGEAFIEALANDFDQFGIEAIQTVRADKPDQYLKVIAMLMPKDLNINVNQMDGLTDDELIERIRALDATIRPFIDLERTGSTRSGAGKATAH
ncbi:MAG: hypothetical protein JWM16_6336 [Verrucomicrobiales bacterium]|nr:hypothetical protein [Verrucomicrobiales bacterium]